LPSETVANFDRDPEANQILWFSGTPINVAHPVPPRYSLTYLHFRASLSRREEEEKLHDRDGVEEDDEYDEEDEEEEGLMRFQAKSRTEWNSTTTDVFSSLLGHSH